MMRFKGVIPLAVSVCLLTVAFLPAAAGAMPSC